MNERMRARADDTPQSTRQREQLRAALELKDYEFNPHGAGGRRGRFVLVRPDAHVAWRSATSCDDPEAAQEALELVLDRVQVPSAPGGPIEPSTFNWIFSGGDTIVCEGASYGEHEAGPWRAGVPEWGAGRWCDVFEIRDRQIHRCFIYLDPGYAGQDTARHPWLAAAREGAAA
jgi:hypothetical protein